MLKNVPYELEIHVVIGDVVERNDEGESRETGDHQNLAEPNNHGS
jgi:hypothetical protein